MAGFSLPGESFINSWYPILIAIAGGLLIGFRSYMKGTSCPSQEKMAGKTVIVTGANTGIGKETAEELARRGARVILACRNEEEGEKVAKTMITDTKNKKVVCMKLDLSDITSIRDFVKEFCEQEERLDVLINNAGVMCHPQAKTKDGFEIHFGTNYLGHFLLTLLLLEKLKSSSPSRIVNVVAPAYAIGGLDFEDLQSEKKEYKPGDAYAQSKLAIMFFTRKLAKILEGFNVTCNAVNPGVVATGIHRYMPFKTSFFIRISFSPFMWLLMKRPKDGAQTSVQCAIAKEEEGVTGKYYSDCVLAPVDKLAEDDEAGDKLWDVTLDLLGLQLESKFRK